MTTTPNNDAVREAATRAALVRIAAALKAEAIDKRLAANTLAMLLGDLAGQGARRAGVPLDPDTLSDVLGVALPLAFEVVEEVYG